MWQSSIDLGKADTPRNTLRINPLVVSDTPTDHHAATISGVYLTVGGHIASDLLRHKNSPGRSTIQATGRTHEGQCVRSFTRRT